MTLKAIFTIALAAIALTSQSQTLSQPMETAVDACIRLSKAIGDASTSPLKAANKDLKAADIADFADIALEKGKDTDLNGHFVFDEEFVDSLIQNRRILSFSARYANRRSNRGSSGVEGRIRMTTRALKAGQSATWKTVNRGVAEFAVVAEPGGLLTMTIKDSTGKVLYAETHDNKKGAPVRKACIRLPENKRSTLLIEIVNHSKTDTSFALLKN